MRRGLAGAAVLGGVALLGGALWLRSRGSAPPGVRVFAASSLTDVLGAVAKDFETATGTRVKLNLASSSTLAQQIVAGAPCDVFLSADHECADAVEKAGLVEPGTRRDLLGNHLVLVEGMGGMPVIFGGTSSDFVDEGEAYFRQHLGSIGRLALGDPDHVPVGKYARRYLEHRPGRWEECRTKVVPCDSARAALELFERGEADAAIVFRTDAKNLRPASVPPGVVPLHAPWLSIRYPVLGVQGISPAGRRFLDALVSTDACRRFEEAGFDFLGGRR